LITSIWYIDLLGFPVQLSDLSQYLVHWPQTVVYESEFLKLPRQLINQRMLFIDDNPTPLNADGSMMLDETCDFNDTWKEMENVLASGKVRSIGVSNFSIKTSGILIFPCWIWMTDCQGCFRMEGWNSF